MHQVGSFSNIHLSIVEFVRQSYECSLHVEGSVWWRVFFGCSQWASILPRLSFCSWFSFFFFSVFLLVQWSFWLHYVSSPPLRWHLLCHWNCNNSSLNGRKFMVCLHMSFGCLRLCLLVCIYLFICFFLVGASFPTRRGPARVPLCSVWKRFSRRPTIQACDGQLRETHTCLHVT